jgi:hypothetical protein
MLEARLLMWDEQERFTKLVSMTLAWLMAVFGLAIAALSLAAGTPDFFLGFLFLLGALAVITLVYGLVAVSLGGLLFALTSAATYCFRWLKNHRFTGPSRPIEL